MRHRSNAVERRHDAFSLIELLVVISIIALLVGILLPTLGSARFSAKVMQDLSNQRQMELAHHAYFTDNGGFMINAGLPHDVVPANPEVAWINTLKQHYNSDLVLRSPLDDSPHWKDDGGVPVPGVITFPPADVYRLTSYGINTHLCDVKGLGVNLWTPPHLRAGPAYTRIDMIEQPSELVHFLLMAFESGFAGADHPHPEDWDTIGGPSLSPVVAADEVETDAVGGPERSFQSKSNYAFLDGSARTVEFGDVYQSADINRFDPHPTVARP